MTDQVFFEMPFDFEAGDPFRAFDRIYYFDRIDEDGVVTLRSRHASGEGDFMVVDEDGMPRKPTVDDMLALMSSRDIVRLERFPQDARARARRLADIDADQARELDELCDFRTHVVRLVEEGRAKGTLSLSDEALKVPVHRAWKLFKKKRREYKASLREAEAKTGNKPKLTGNRWKRPKKKPCGATVRTWYRTRGAQGSRKVSDGVSDTGRSVRARVIDHPIEILANHATRALIGRSGTYQRIREYRAELKMISEGRAFARGLAEVDADGNWRLGEKPANYPAPASEYTPVSDGVFYDLVRTMRSKKAYAIQTSAKGAMQRYEGGGQTEVPSRVGALGEIDDTPVPNLFLMCEVTALPLGGATATVILDVCSRLIVGSDLSWESANTNTVLRTILDANRPKSIPQKMLEDLPTEGAYLANFAPSWAMKFNEIRGDNLAAFHGVQVEDACMDTGIVTSFTAKHQPRAKPHIENVLGVLQRMLFKVLPDARWDAALAGRFGFDPKTQVLCTLQQARELFEIAIIIYNCTGHGGLDGKQPALVRKEHSHLYRVPLINGEEKLRRAMMRTEKSAEFGADGIRAFGRRYSATEVTAKIYGDLERAARNRANHLGPKQKKRRNTGHKQRPTYSVIYKYNEDDLGSIYVWNPHHLPKGDWVEVPCTDPEMKGRPKALHDLRTRVYGEAADEFIEPSTEDILHAYLGNEISNITEASSDREKTDHAKVMDTIPVSAALANFVTVENESALTARQHHNIERVRDHLDRSEKSVGESFSPNVAPTDVAAPYRKDGHTHTPRPDPHQRKRSGTTETPSKRGGGKPKPPPAIPEVNTRRKRRTGTLGWGDVG